MKRYVSRKVPSNFWGDQHAENYDPFFVDAMPLVVFEEDVGAVDTGLLDHRGAAIIRIEYRNPIGFHAQFDD